MNILLANDDGIDAIGIIALGKALCTRHNVYVVAPAYQQSGMSQALTIHRPIKVKKNNLGWGEVEAYAVEGTPADCVKLALETILLDKSIDLVVSGINKGYNIGTDLLYSGTVGAALEGHVHGLNSIAVSLGENSTLDIHQVSSTVVDLIDRLIDTEKTELYNINFPLAYAQGCPKITFTHQGKRTYENEYDVVEVKPGEVDYLMKGRAKNLNNKPLSDIETVNRGEISITPLLGNRTDFTLLSMLD